MNTTPALPVVRAALHAAVLWGVLVAPAPAACDVDIADAMTREVNRIRDCLHEIAARPVEVPVPGGHAERLLYTWGPEIKIRRMLDDPYFCDYEYARQVEFEYRQYLELPTSMPYWGDRPWLRSMSQLAALANAANDTAPLFPEPYREEAVEQAPDAGLWEDGAPPEPAPAASGPYLDEPVETAPDAGLWADAERWEAEPPLPQAELKGRSVQFALAGLRDLGMPQAQRYREIERQAQQLEARNPGPNKSAAAGRLAAVRMIEGSGAAAGSLRESSIKGGLGVYFSSDPFRYFEAGTRPAGLVCRTPSQPVIIDRSDQETARFLAAHRITVQGATLNLPGAKTIPTLENPALFDEAARGRYIIRLPAYLTGGVGRQSAYVDKCVMPYDNAQVCRRVTIEEPWLSCEDFRRLTGLSWMTRERRFRRSEDLLARKPDADATNQALHAQIVQSDGQLFAETFRQRFSQCYGVVWEDKYLGLLGTADDAFVRALTASQ
ncbi:MAG: hypothetical protein R3F42_05100 [Pseudomonadota bacterium]